MGIQPDFRLAALDKVILYLELRIDQRQLLTHLDKKVVLVHPVVEH